MDAIKQQAKIKLDSLKAQSAILSNEISRNTEFVKEAESFLIKNKSRYELLSLTSQAVQEITDAVSKVNLKRIEDLTNLALSSIITDQVITIRIDQDIKRNMVTYNIKICKDGVEGTINSIGGTTTHIIGFVLKVLILIMSKRFRLLALDESLNFISEKYVPATSEFIKTVSKMFNLPILLVTHQPLFAANTDHLLEATSTNNVASFQLIR